MATATPRGAARWRIMFAGVRRMDRRPAEARVGPRRAVASAQDERILNERRRYRDPHFDSSAVRTAAVGDLRVSWTSTCRRRSMPKPWRRTTEPRRAPRRRQDDRVGGRPTVAGVLVLGKQPQQIRAVSAHRRPGMGRRGPGRGALRRAGDLVSRVDDKLIAHNRTAVEFISSPTETRRSTYPLGALQQLVRNAVMHRAYDGTNAPVHVYWFDDRIEINSPGGPYGALTPETFGRPGVIDYRNPTLAEAMRVLGLVQRYGFGIPAARRELRAAGQRDPEFRGRALGALHGARSPAGSAHDPATEVSAAPARYGQVAHRFAGQTRETRLREKLEFLQHGMWDAGVRVKKLRDGRSTFEARLTRSDRILFTSRPPGRHPNLRLGGRRTTTCPPPRSASFPPTRRSWTSRPIASISSRT